MQASFRRALHAATQSLNEVLSADGVDAAALATDLWAAAAVVDDNPSLRRGLADPSREGSEKADLAKRLFGGKISDAAVHVIRGVVAQRWVDQGDVVSATETMGIEAMLSSAEKNGRLAQVEDELFRFDRIVAGAPELRAALSERRASDSAKADLIGRLLSQKSAPETARLAQQAAAALRGRRFDHGLAHMLDQAAERQDQVTAVVTSATALSPEQLERLAATLTQKYGRRVSTQVVIDPSVVGGLKVEIADDIIDGTVSARLAKAQREMTT